MKSFGLFGVARFGVERLGDVLAFPLCLPYHLWVMCGHAEALWRKQGGK
jgi:hypothetical protein